MFLGLGLHHSDLCVCLLMVSPLFYVSLLCVSSLSVFDTGLGNLFFKNLGWSHLKNLNYTCKDHFSNFTHVLGIKIWVYLLGGHHNPLQRLLE